MEIKTHMEDKESVTPSTQNGNTTKKCTKCTKEFPLECFNKKNQSHDGLSYRCKACDKGYSKQYLQSRAKGEILRGRQFFQELRETSQKSCSACKEILPATDEFFYRNKTKGDGFSLECKECVNKRNKEYYARSNIRKQKSLDMKVYNENYYSQPGSREHVRNYHDEYYTRPHAQELRRASGRNRRARTRSVKGTHSSKQILDLLKRQKYNCYYCQKPLKKNKDKYIYHVDHTYPISRIAGTDIPANSIDYLVIACPACNTRKSDKFPWEFPEGGRLL
jgi:hypothetical protein